MAALTDSDHVAARTPSGVKLDDGFSTTIAFQNNDDVSLWEKTIKPPGIDYEDAIDTTTMHNTTWRTFAERSLRTLTECTFVAAYCPDAFTDVYRDGATSIHTNQIITVHFPDTARLSFWGYVRVFEPNECVEGEQPTANVTIQPTNQDNSGNEVAPLMTAYPEGTAL